MRSAGALLIAVLLLACPGTAAMTVQDYFDRGIVYDDQGQHDKALDAYDQGLELDPNNAQLWGAKGRVLMIRERYAEAAAAYNRSVRLDPSQEYARAGERAALAALANATAASTSAPTATTTTPAAGVPWWAAVVTVAGAAGLVARGRRRR
ncbi:MAG: tetratricopeptide repeat protein [Methanospirillum sp.]